METEKWLEIQRANAQRAYENEVAVVAAWAERIDLGTELIKAKIPAVIRHLQQKDYKVDPIKRVGQPGMISEFAAVVFLGEGDSKQIYGVHFSSEDFPSLNIKKGFTVRYCHDSAKYKNVISYAGRPEIWTEMGERTPKFLEIVGLVLDESLPMLTEDIVSMDLNRALSLLEEQTGKLP